MFPPISLILFDLIPKEKRVGEKKDAPSIATHHALHAQTVIAFSCKSTLVTGYFQIWVLDS